MTEWPKGYAPLNGCHLCGRDFAGVRYFDAHRVGSHAYDFDLEHPDGRRCRTDEELAALGIRQATPEELAASRKHRARAGSGVSFYLSPGEAARLRAAFAVEVEHEVAA